MDKFQAVKSYFDEYETDFGLTRYDVKFLIEEIERLRIIEAAYEGLRKAL